MSIFYKCNIFYKCHVRQLYKYTNNFLYNKFCLYVSLKARYGYFLKSH